MSPEPLSFRLSFANTSMYSNVLGKDGQDGLMNDPQAVLALQVFFSHMIIVIGIHPIPTIICM